jgi:succinate dehydrogenase / fumarate reductase cytochrome b subunit
MQRETGFFASSIGKKVVMAITGLMLVGFVLGHMAGNLQLYMHPHGGEHPLDAYGRFLKEMLHGGGIWIARGGLLAAALLHVWAAVGLTKMNREARPVAYAVTKPQASTLSSRLMRVSGVIVLLFIVFHLAHFTFGKFTPFEEGKVFHNVVEGFKVPWVSGFYIVAMLALASHLSHGIWSLMQTLGWNHPKYNDLRKKAAWAITAVVVLANISFPLAVLSGFVK